MIKRASAKAKGRKLQNEICEEFSRISGIEVCKDGDIEGRPMGQSGVDICFRGRAKKLFPFSIECKYQEKWSIPNWIQQAKANRKKGTDWLLFVRRNRNKACVVMSVDLFFRLLKVVISKKSVLKLRKANERSKNV